MQITWMRTVPARSANSEQDAAPAKLVFGIDGAKNAVFELDPDDHQQLLCLVAGLRHLGVVPAQDFLYNPTTHKELVSELVRPDSDTVVVFGAAALDKLASERRQLRLQAEREKAALAAKCEVTFLFFRLNSPFFYFFCVISFALQMNQTFVNGTVVFLLFVFHYCQ